MSGDIVVRDGDEGEDSGITERQINALQKLYDLGGEPRKDGEKYSPDRKIRMQQLIYEGRAGGPQAGGGRPRKARASQEVANYVRDYLTPHIKAALKKGMSAEDVIVQLKTADLALKIERDEAALALREEQSDIDNATKEQLIAALIAFARDPGTEAALEATVIDIPDTSVKDITHVNGDAGGNAEAEASGGAASAISDSSRVDDGEAGSNGSAAPEGIGAPHPNPFAEVARRGAAKRRRAA